MFFVKICKNDFSSILYMFFLWDEYCATLHIILVNNMLYTYLIILFNYISWYLLYYSIIYYDTSNIIYFIFINFMQLLIKWQIS